MYVTVLFPFKMYRDVKIRCQRHQWKKILAIRPPSSASQESESEEVSENSDVQFCYERDEDWVAMEREAEEVNFDMESERRKRIIKM